MSVNPDQAIFDAIAAATDHNDDGIFISVQTFIEVFNGHRDRKLCTSLDSYEVMHLKAMLANEHQKTVPVEDRNRIAQKASVPVTQPFTGTKEAMHYLGAIKVRLELLYEHSTQDARLLEHLSDEIDWVDAEIDRLRSGGVAQTPCGECHLQDGEVCDICGRSYGLAQTPADDIECLRTSNDQRGKDLATVIAQRDAAEQALRALAHSPPAFHAPHNSGERLPSGDAADAGGEATCTRCGLPKSEHHYNGAAYGVCGDYTTVAQEPSGLANLQAIVADQPFQNSALSVYEINLILENKGGFMPDEAVTWFRASRGTFGTAHSPLEAALRAIIIRCDEGDKKSDWLPIISDIAKRALQGAAQTSSEHRKWTQECNPPAQTPPEGEPR